MGAGVGCGAGGSATTSGFFAIAKAIDWPGGTWWIYPHPAKNAETAEKRRGKQSGFIFAKSSSQLIAAFLPRIRENTHALPERARCLLRQRTGAGRGNRGVARRRRCCAGSSCGCCGRRISVQNSQIFHRMFGINHAVMSAARSKRGEENDREKAAGAKSGVHRFGA